MMPLPKIMVAPNGAYKTKADHPNIPVTLAETVAAVVQAHAAGATGAHVHIRNDDQSHLLDSVQYRTLIDDITARCPDLYVQITTEAAGKYTSQFQRDLILDVAHPYVSAAIVELLRDCSRDDLATFMQNAPRKVSSFSIYFTAPMICTCFTFWCAVALSLRSKTHFCLCWGVTRQVKNQTHRIWIHFWNAWMQMSSRMQIGPFAPLVRAKRPVWSMQLNVGARHGLDSKITC